MNDNIKDEHDLPKGFDVRWEPWVDAYKQEQDRMDEELGGYEEHEEDLMFEENFSRPIKTVMTPFGLMPLTEQSLASSHFKLWVGHSNFKLQDDYYPIIEACEGVETVDILTPYRFRLGIGRLFKDREVMYRVRNALVGTLNEQQESR